MSKGLTQIRFSLSVRMKRSAQPLPSGGVLDARFEALELLVGVDLQIELENMDAVPDQHLLEVVDLPVAFRPDGLGDHVVHALDQHLFVV